MRHHATDVQAESEVVLSAAPGQRPGRFRRTYRVASQALVWALLAAGFVRPAAAAEWRPAPLFGADVRALAIDPGDPDLVLAGTSAGQVYLSRDGGATWADAGAPRPFGGWVIGGLHFDPNQPSRVWAALWGVWGGGHVAFSDDLGKHWAARGEGLPQEPVYALALVPGKEGWLYAGTLSGVWGSRNGGLAWKRLTDALPEMGKVTSLLVDARQPATVIAGTWRRAYRSDDGGGTWYGVFEGMVLDSEVFSLTPVPERPGEVWATTCGWVYRTADLGGRWERFKEGLDERRTPSFAVLPDGRLLAGTVGGLYVSGNGGQGWERRTAPDLSINVVAYHPERPRRILLATEGSGVWLSIDGAATFRRAARGMTNLRVTALATAGRELLVAVNHAGPYSGVHSSRDGGRTFAPDFAPLPTVIELATQGERAWAATERGLFEREGSGADGGWARVPALGEGRVEQVLAEPGPSGMVVARSASALIEREADGRWVEKPLKHGTPRSAAFYGGALWVSAGEGLHRLTPGANHSTTSPYAGGRLSALGDRLLFWGSQGAWSRQGEDALWIELAAKPSRVLATGDGRYAAILIAGLSDEGAAQLYDRERGTLRRLELPVPARDVAAALILDGQLYLGTSGYGLLIGDLPVPPAAAPAAPAMPPAAE